MIERYSRPQMSRIWGLENKYRAWLQVEVAVCEAWHKQGRIPADAMQQIRDHADFDLDRIQAIEEETKHDVIAFLTAVEEQLGPASRYIHLGCTSSDIVDTANALLLVQAGRIISGDLDTLLNTLHRLGAEHQGRLCMGRTHGVHAEPMSYGLKMASFHAEFSRHKQRFDNALEGIRVGKISGAVGTYAHLSPEVERDALHMLGLEPDPVSTQIVQRDRHAEYFTALALVAGGIERLALELRHLQRTEVREAEEGFSKGQKGSSAMPHKKNPISAENLCGLARLVRSNALSAMENMALWHERDISHSSVERVIMPDSTILMDYMLNRLNSILTKLRLIPENIDRNLEASHGLYFSQRLLLALLEKEIPRQKAYELVQEPALRAWEEGRSFRDLVLEDEAITSRISRSELDELFDPGYYLRYEQEILDRVFTKDGK
jgi:adenylosuccinate lyase